MAFVFSQRSLNNLKGVHPKLVAVMTKALEYTEYDYTITEGLRSYERQVQLKAEGKSKTLKSYHLKQSDGYGHAVDVVALVPQPNGKSTISWDEKYYWKINEAVQKAAAEVGVKITAGVTWGWDCPHFQIEL